MLATLAVISIIAGIVIFNHQAFRRDVSLSNDTYRLALAVREAQVSGLTAQQVPGFTGEEQYFAGYGVKVEKGGTGYILFADNPNGTTPGNRIYTDTGPTADEVVEVIRLEEDIELKNICDMAAGSCQPRDRVDVVFYRAEPTASIATQGSGGLNTGVSHVRIILETVTSGIQRCVDIRDTGQISVLGNTEC